MFIESCSKREVENVRDKIIDGVTCLGGQEKMRNELKCRNYPQKERVHVFMLTGGKEE